MRASRLHRCAPRQCWDSGILASIALLTALLGALNVLGWPTASWSSPALAATCAADTEPNDAVSGAAALPDALPCADGALPANDQDLYRWTLRAEDAGRFWTITLDGLPQTRTLFELFRLGADGVTTGSPLLTLAAEPGETGVVSEPDLILQPGTYIVATGRGNDVAGYPIASEQYRVELIAGDPISWTTPPDPGPLALDGVGTLAVTTGNSAPEIEWTVPETEPAGAWELHLQTSAGTPLQVDLRDADGAQLVRVTAAGPGKAPFYDLALEPGLYRVVIVLGASPPWPLWVQAIHHDSPPADDREPNDELAGAQPIHPGETVRGRLTPLADLDTYRLELEGAAGDKLLDLRLRWRAPLERELCVLDEQGDSLQCRKGVSGVRLTDLGLPGEVAFVRVSGPPAPGDQYLLRIEVTSQPAAGAEIEPNDELDIASRVPPEHSLTGRFDGDDTDLLQLTVEGDPQLWDVAVTGSGIRTLALVDARSRDLTQSGSEDGAQVRLSDLFLTAGRHWFRLQGTDGAYAVRFVANGPPDPQREREPNNSNADAQPIAPGEERSGRFADPGDVDIYRFSLLTAEHLLLSVQSPPASTLSYSLSWGDTLVARGGAAGIGAAILSDFWLQPGDYTLNVEASQPSPDLYRLSINRGDPFFLPVDTEPNNDATLANPAPPSLHIEGVNGVAGEEDWYRLPPASGPTTMTVAVSLGSQPRITGSNGGDIPLQQLDPGVWQAQLPPGQDSFLVVYLAERYAFDLTFDPGPAPVLPAPSRLEVALTTGTPEVAAYQPYGQVIAANVKITAPALLAVSLKLEAMTTDPRWQVDLGSAPGAAATVADGMTIRIRAPADAWADLPVRVFVHATSGRERATGWLDITPRRDARPVHPFQTWTLPSALLGGLDVASLALGATPAGDLSAEGEAQLHDGFAFPGSGLVITPGAFPVAITVDLAGNSAVPIAGIALDQLGGDAFPHEGVRAFELQLSVDGQSYDSAFAGELAPRWGEQSFVLPAPVEAKFARLLVHSTWSDPPGRLVLGEWKVIAVPGVVPDSMTPVDLADPPHGGHVVWLEPQPDVDDQARSILTADPARTTVRPGPTGGCGWVVGFHDGRAAQIETLTWADPTGSIPEQRLGHLAVAVSLTSPLGPWQPVADWPLDRDPAGAVAPLNLPAGTWARFVRFDCEAPTSNELELPAKIGILEHPADDSYRSIIAEWGEGRPEGIFEQLQPPDFSFLIPAPDSDSAPSSATPLDPGPGEHGVVRREIDVDWYVVTIPRDQHRLELKIAGQPAATVDATLFTGTLQAVDATSELGEGGVLTITAQVEPGATYYIRVEQPRPAIILGFDTSASMGRFFDFVAGAMRVFVAGVQPGGELVNLMPFQDRPLLETWSDQPYLLQSALNDFAYESFSSGSEASLLFAATDLATHPGQRAIVLVTDAESSTFQRTAEMWRQFAVTWPRIFAVQIGAGSRPEIAQQLMQDWTAVNGGYYTGSISQAEIDRAFDRAATLLGQPAAYRIQVEFTPANDTQPSEDEQVAATGTLSVVAGEGDASSDALAHQVTYEIILDTSGSMLQEIEPGLTRADVAKRALRKLVAEGIPPGAPVALRAFGTEPGSCETRLIQPLAPLDPMTIEFQIANLEVVNEVKTPLGAALARVGQDLAGATGPRIVILVTDGEETCGGDAAAAIAALAAQGVDVHVNIVGFALNDDALRAQFGEWARLGNGSYFDAANAAGLERAIANAALQPFHVVDAQGVVVATGTVGGDPVELPPGTYSVIVIIDPQRRVDGIVIESGQPAEVVLDSGE